MCGIFCAFNQDDAGNLVLSKLKSLQYRGYDSFGIYCPTWDGTIDCHIRKVGPIETKLNIMSNKTNCLGHVRWASVGEISKGNCHPIKSTFGHVFICHNGNIENINDFDFKSHNTLVSDTKIFADYLEKYKFSAFSSKIDGNNAFVAVFPSEKNSIFVKCTGNKQIFISENGFISSEKSLIPNGRIAAINSEHSLLKVDFTKQTINDTLLTKWFDINAEESFYYQANNNTFDVKFSGMLFEIMSQVVPQSIVKIPTIDKNESYTITGCGSSYYAAMFGKYCLEGLGYDIECEYASQLKYRHNNFRKLIAISQSGETADILNIVDNYPDLISITNHQESILAKKSKHVIPIGVGVETAVASTKTFTGSCIRLMEMSGFSDASKEYRANASIHVHNSLLEKILDKVYNKYRTVQKFLFLGDYIDYPIALEGALKMKEVAYYSADGMPASEIKHGPIALIDDNTLSVFVLSSDNNQSTINNIKEILSRKGKVLVISNLKNENSLNKLDCDCIYLELTNNIYINSLISLIPLQYLAYYTAVRDNKNPDMPRHLAKCVTV